MLRGLVDFSRLETSATGLIARFMCNQKHPVWKCEVLTGKENNKKREAAKKLGLCYRCLGKGHLSEECHWIRECVIDG